MSTGSSTSSQGSCRGRDDNARRRRQRRELTPPWRAHIGLLLAGWGAFDVVEGLIDHQIPGIHHVRDDLGAPLPWDIGFLAFGVAFIVAGAALLRSGERLAALNDVA